MSALDGPADKQDSLTSTNINLTNDEKAVFGKLFRAADTQSLGVITGEVAVKFFEKSGLNPRILGEIWGFADTENRGLLDKIGFSVALRLIGRAQNGELPQRELANTPGPLPRFEGVDVVYPQSVQMTGGLPPPASPTVSRVPPIVPQDVEKFGQLFDRSGPTNGILGAEKAKNIFLKAGLADQTLGIIWSLADRTQRGALDSAEFVVAMHLIQQTRQGALPNLPSLLPQALFESAGRRSGRGPVPPNRTGAFPAPLQHPLKTQFSGSSGRAQSPLHRQFTPPLQQQGTGGDIPWAVTPQEFLQFEGFFIQIDKEKKGYITGDEAVQFFRNSKLPEEVLATIWDLADITKQGKLSKEEFAIAMKLIRVQRSPIDGRIPPLPETLPREYIPPNMRQPLMRQSPIAALPPPPPKQTSAADDLFELDLFGTPPQALAAGPTGFQAPPGQIDDIFGGSKPASNAPVFQSQGRPGFIPTSLFGQTVQSPSNTGGSGSAAPPNFSRGLAGAQSVSSPPPEDLLGEVDPEISKKLTSETAELANLSNQVTSLTKQSGELSTKKKAAEAELNTINSQKQNIEARLLQIRTVYDTEVKEVQRVEKELAAARTAKQKANQDLTIASAQLHELQNQRQTLNSQLEADQRENRSLQDKMRAVNTETAQLRPILEKLKSDARHQKGMATIARKQHSTAEGERDKMKAEIDEMKAAAAAAAATSQVPPPASPSLSTTSAASTNPFDKYRRTPSQADNAFSPGSFSPSAGPPPQASLDQMFGSPSSTFSGPPPPTSFNRQVQPPSNETGTSLAGAGSGPSASATSDNADITTPPTSPPTSSYHNSPQQTQAEVPPVVHNPITSAQLPLPVTRTDSITSSVQNNPPASVHASTSRPDTPTNIWGPAIKSPNVYGPGTPSANSAAARSPFEEKPQPPMPAAKIEDTVSKSIVEPTRPAVPQPQNSYGFPMPGSFPPAQQEPALKPAQTGESQLSDHSKSSSKPNQVTFGNRTSDPFSSKDEPSRDAASSKSDFDSAFADMGITSRGKQPERSNAGPITTRQFDKEFPPLHEFDLPDDSDSEDGKGFDDDFTAASPSISKAAPAKTDGTLKPTLPVFSQVTGSEGPGTPLPAANSQSSPPPYTSKSEGSSGFPMEYSGLIPSRATPSQPELSVSPQPQSSNPFPTGPPTSQPTARTASFGQSSTGGKPPTSKVSFDDDFESQFADLTEAKDLDLTKNADDDFSMISRDEGFDDFNPTFDSPAPATASKNATGNSTNTNTTATTGTGGGVSILDNDFSNFNFDIGSSGSSGKPPKEMSSDAWDSLFGSPSIGSNAEQQNSKTPTSAAAKTAGGSTSTSKPATNGHSSSPFAPIDKPSLPQRQMSIGSPDDELVTNLMAFGVSRDQALQALEKHNYNYSQAASSVADMLPKSP